MNHLLLTGATGLLGTYLARDLLASGVRLCVVVRSTRYASARQRIEDALTLWEQQLGYALPRPVVLEGDLTQPNLGLGEDARQWVARQCNAVLHNAASLTFVAESPEGEPWRTNVEGTRHVLDLCRECGIDEFHHVSTAYVCGLRSDCVREDELEAGQELGNDYERSKVRAEQMVRSAAFLKSPTIYRPAIIIGDSQTGYTTTFHGFYVPLKVISALITRMSSLGLSREELTQLNRQGGAHLRELLGLRGHETKNYVPVDWVSAVTAHIVTHREHHGRTYHLTPRNRVPVATMQRVFEDAVTDEIVAAPKTNSVLDWDAFQDDFLEQMRVYESYWRDDPQFDNSNTLSAAPHLPCPTVDERMLELMCRYALDTNFGWPRRKSVVPEFDVWKHVGGLRKCAASGASRHVNLEVTGPGGGTWSLSCGDDCVELVDEGADAHVRSTIHLNSRMFRDLAARRATIAEALATGRIHLEGENLDLQTVDRVLDGVMGRTVPRDEAEPIASTGGRS